MKREAITIPAIVLVILYP